MARFDTVIISDLHLGARNSRSRQIVDFLHWVRTDRLILAGDVFDRPDLGGLRPGCFRVIETLAMLSRSTELIWVRGNHDPVEATLPEWRVEPRDEVVINVGRDRYLVCHGHVWDKSLNLPNWLIDATDAVYHFTQWMDPSHKLARWLKRGSKQFVRSVQALQEHAVSEAGRRGLAGVVLGHSHVARHTFVDGVHYLNCGCWTEIPSGFIGVRNGKARRYYWESIVRGQTVVPAAAEPQCAVFGMGDGGAVAPLVQEAV